MNEQSVLSRLVSSRTVRLFAAICLIIGIPVTLSSTSFAADTRGGLFRDINKSGDGLDTHHMPSRDSYLVDPNLNEKCGPAINMTPEDHRKTASFGKGNKKDGKGGEVNADDFRNRQRELIRKGDIRGALQIDIDNLRDLFGDRYDEAIEQALEALQGDGPDGSTSGMDECNKRHLPRGVANRATSTKAAVSGDGRKVVFESPATNLTARDTNEISDIFVRDLADGSTKRLSESSTGGQSNGPSGQPAISRDGNIVAFVSSATNLIPDASGVTDIFVHDLRTGTTTSLTSGANGSIAPKLSASGEHVVFQSSASNLVVGDTNGLADIFVTSRSTGVTTLVSQGPSGAPANGFSLRPDISAAGLDVSFTSHATNLGVFDTNGRTDIYLKNISAGTVRRVSTGPNGEQAAGSSDYSAMSGDAQLIAFQTDASLVSYDTNGIADVYARQIVTGQLYDVSVLHGLVGGGEAPSVSDNGDIAFQSLDENFSDPSPVYDIFEYNPYSGKRWTIDDHELGRGNGHSLLPSLSADGLTLVFPSADAAHWSLRDTNLVPDLYVHTFDIARVICKIRVASIPQVAPAFE